MNPIVNVNCLSFSYPDGTSALGKINFSVEESTCVALLGANGSGKTTLLYCLIGVIPHIIYGNITGNIEVANYNISESNLDSIIRRVAIVQQDPESQILSATVEAECAFAPSNFGIEPQEIRRRIGWALDVVGLAGFEGRATHTLSYGQKQRLAIAAALTMEPSVMLLDEPFSNVDSLSRKQILSILGRLKKDKKITIIISIHDISGIVGIVDYVLLLSMKGEQIAFGPVKEVLRQLELLCVAGINQPPMLELAVKLGMSELPFTVDEMCRLLVKSTKITELPLPELGVRDQVVNSEKEWKGELLIDLINLSYSYPAGNLALNNINIQINRGEMVGIIGPNGSGKTTLLKHFVGLLRPTVGRVIFNRQDIKDLSIGQLSKDIGIVMQNPDHQLVHAKTVFEEVRYGLELYYSDDQIELRALNALKIVNLETKRDIYPGKLSFGEKKKLMIACMIAKEPQVLVLDEPFFGLDYSGKTSLVNILNSLGRNKQTLIVVSHDLDSIAKCVGRIVVLYQGQITHDDKTETVLAELSVDKDGVEPPEIVQLKRCLKNRWCRCDLASHG